MGAHIEVAALLDAAGRFDAAAATLDRTARGRAAFGAAGAGRAHVAHGDAVRAEIDRLSDDLRAWARADAEIASVLRASADRYIDADTRVTARLS
jgi:uncharacterized protein YukE